MRSLLWIYKTWLLAGSGAFYESACYGRRLRAREKMRNHSAMAVKEVDQSAWFFRRGKKMIAN